MIKNPVPAAVATALVILALAIGATAILYGPGGTAPPPAFSGDPGLMCAQYCEDLHGWVVQVEGSPGAVPTCVCDTWRVTANCEFHISPREGPCTSVPR